MVFSLRDSTNKKYNIVSPFQIGSDVSNRLVLLDPMVAPVHAAVIDQNGTLFLQDLSGGTLTKVNDVSINGTTVLRNGDKLQFGNSIFMIEDVSNSSNQAFSAPSPVNPNLPVPPPQSQPVKDRPGCGRWILIALLVFLGECLLIGLGAFFYSLSDVEIRGGLQEIKGYLSSEKSSETAPSDLDQPGPEILKLDDQWLTGSFSNAFSQKVQDSVEGVSPENLPFNTSYVFYTEEQNTSGWYSYMKNEQMVNGGEVNQVEKSIQNGTIYSGTDQCVKEADPQSGNYSLDGTPLEILTKVLQGHVKLVEEGVTINGVVADRYEIRRDNFVNSDSVIEVINGSLYRAREGGYLVQADYSIKVKPQTWTINIGEDFSTTEPTQITYHFERTYLPDDSLQPKLPEICK
jgi:pSer/pThr/pTyr-binding forkhead associated (FHA) protein